MKWFKKVKPIAEEKHVHDWEIAYTYPIEEVAKRLGLEYTVTMDGYHEYLRGNGIILYPSEFHGDCYFPTACKKVCLSCGECIDGFDRYKKVHDKKVQKAKISADRIALAKRMWKDCKGDS